MILEDASPQTVLPHTDSQPPQQSGSIPLQNETRALWCLINGDSVPFNVTVPENAFIDRLKELIKEKGKKGVLSSVDAKDLTLWKVGTNDQQDPPLHEWISLKPSKTLADRVRSYGEDFSAFAMQLEPVDTVSEVFPGQPAQNRLHIIVQVPSPATGISSVNSNLSTVSTFSEKLTDNDDPMVQYWEYAWGNALPSEAVQAPQIATKVTDAMEVDDDESEFADSATDFQNGDLLPNRPLLDCTLEGSVQRLIRAEYLRIFNFVQAVYDNRAESQAENRPPVVIVTGQPGIGKSVWLQYAFRRRLGDRCSTILYKDSCYFRFTEDGVARLVKRNEFRYNPKEPPWCLIDSADAPDGLPGSLGGQGLPGIFPIYASSPDNRRWSHLHQSKTRHVAYMNPWTWEEVEYAAINLYPTLDLETVRARFDNVGPTARLCLEYKPGDIDQFVQERQRQIAKSAAPNALSFLVSLIDDVTGLARNIWPASSEYHPNLSHKICLIRRRYRDKDYSQYDVFPMSRSVINELLLNKKHCEENAVLDMWRGLSKHPGAMGMAGTVWESYIHIQFRKHIDITAEPMFQFLGSQGRFHALSSDYSDQPQLRKAKLNFLAAHPHSITCNMPPLANFIYKNKEKIAIEESCYYQPESQTQVGIDAFFVFENCLYLLQYTAGQRHSIKDGLTSFLERLDPLPEKKRLIFIIPDTLTTFSCVKPPNQLQLYTAKIKTSA